MTKSWRILGLFLTGAAVFSGMAVAFAADDSSVEAVDSAEINSLQEEIDEKQASIDQIERKVEEYRKKIDAAQTRSASLANELDLLENRIAKTALDIESNNAAIDSVNAEIKILDVQIRTYDEQLTRDRVLIAQILQTLQSYDNDVGLQLLFGTDSFAELFDRLQLLENVNGDLVDTLKRAESAQAAVQLARTEQEGKRTRLVELQKTLESHKKHLEEETGAKDSLLAASQQSEVQFLILVQNLREEMAYIDHQVAVLQGEIEDKLTDADDIGDSSILSWPVDPEYRGISTLFHDPTYPFRHLFEHSGLDIPQPQGTPVESAAAGYVAWTRTGRLYGNYVMVIHTNGVATLYAHLSKISVSQDQFVARGDTLGLSGGLPGTPGAGLSTGPHLHFEVRKEGIPVDPMGYLISQ